MRSLFSFLFLFLFCDPVLADIYKCDGNWTNRPCDGVVEEKIEAGESIVVSEHRRVRSAKRSVLHDLRMDIIEAKRDYEVELSIVDVEEFCFADGTSIQDCREKINETKDHLDAKLTQAKLVRAKEKEIELQEESNKLKKEEASATTTVHIYEREPRLRRVLDHPNHLELPRAPKASGQVQQHIEHHSNTFGGTTVIIQESRMQKKAAPRTSRSEENRGSRLGGLSTSSR